MYTYIIESLLRSTLLICRKYLKFGKIILENVVHRYQLPFFSVAENQSLEKPMVNDKG